MVVLLTIGISFRSESLTPIPRTTTSPCLQRSLGAMDPNLKLILEELQKSKEEIVRRFDDHDASGSIGSSI